MKKSFFLILFTWLSATIINAQEFVKGGQFMDYILPLQGTVAATASDWGTASGSYVKNGETLTWPGTLGRWKDNGIEDNTYSYWGGNVQKGDDGKYHIFVAGWPESSPSGHDTWKTGSRCYHGVSDKPDQGFVFKEELGAGHNTESYRVADGRTVVYNIELRYISNETTLTEATTWTQSKFDWDLRDRRLQRGNDRTVSLSNCTFARRPDNSFLMMDRGGCVWVSRDGVDTYHQQTDHTAYAGNRTRYFEDPVIWYDGMQYFMVVNDYDAKQAYLSRSLDGIHWVNEPGVAYKVGIIYNTNNNTKEDWFKIERPKVQKDEYGRATYIHFAVVDCEKDADKGSDTHSSKNIIAPLVKARFMEVVEPTVYNASATTYKVKIKKEDDFDPVNINLSTLVFGSYDKVNYGNGFKASTSETDGDGNLIVTFTGAAGESGITVDEWAPKVIGQTTSGDIVYGYAKLPYVNYAPAMVSAMIPGIDENNYITSVKVDNYGLSASEEMNVKVMTTSGTVLSTGTVHAIDPYESENVALTGSKKPTAGIEQIVIAFFKGEIEVDRNTLYTDDIKAQQTELARLVPRVAELLADDKYTNGKDDLTTIYNEAVDKLAWFDAEQLKDLNNRMEQAIKTFLYANGITKQSWNFYTAALADGTITMTNNNAITSNGHSMKIADYMTVSGEQQKFYGRIAMDQGGSYLNLRNNGEGVNNTGLFNFNNDSYFSILNLVPGDEVTFSLADMDQLPTIVSENVYVKGDEDKTILTAGTQITDGTTYVLTGSQMDILTEHYTCITGVNVETADPESVTTPSISVDGAFKVIIAPGESSAGTEVQGTYYTTDGSTPTQESTLYTAPFTVSKNTLVKAVTYLPNGTASAVKAIRATVPDQTWDFTDNTTWTDDKLTNNKQYDSSGNEVQAGGVLFNFESEKASFYQRSTAALWWLISGSSTQPASNYIQIVVPTYTKLTVNSTGWSGDRCYWYTVNGTTGSAGTKFATSENDRSHEFTNTTGSSQTYTIWVNDQFSGTTPQIYISSIVMKDISEVFEHDATITAKCGDTQIDQWTMTGIEEFSDYTISGKAYIKKDGQLYVINDSKFTGVSSRNYSYITTMELEDQDITINYDRYVTGDIAFFAEAEDLNNVGTNNSVTASGGKTAHANSGKLATLATLPAGHYSIYVGMIADRDVYLRNAGIADNNNNTILYWNKNQYDTKEFDLTESTQLALSGYTTGGGGLNQAGDVDFVLIRTTGVDVPAASYGYQTFASDCALDFSETTTKAYIATSTDGDNVYFEQIMKVPAGTGLLLQGTDAEPIPVLTTDETDDVIANLLHAGDGSVINKEYGYNKYVLALDDDNTNVSFYLINGTSATVEKGKAYLKTASSSNARQLCFSFGTPTDIKSINQNEWTEVNSQRSIVYNLAGQRVDKPTKGIYIKNGKKYIR